ncbi:MAG: 16S rRNA (cytosine(967)-C(5))-methyltransferase RsmB, partial [Desulfobacterales bacterium]|nr:16S rRNA (cytosine(967)-C(5))-methyltransferase RsmB [Desulfobacterales bacterium]
MIDARTLSFIILNRCDQEKIPVDTILTEVVDQHNQMDKRDKALMTSIVFGVLRWRNNLDWMISQVSKMPIKKMDIEVLNSIRIALFQIFFLDRIPVSAAVNSSVNLIKVSKPKWASGFVNGILRNIIRNKNHLRFPDSASDPIQYLTTRCSFPEWMIHRWIKQIGFQNTEKRCYALNHIPPITLRTNTLKVNRQTLYESLITLTEDIQNTKYASQGIQFFRPYVSINEMKPYQDGWFQVQDEAAQLITDVLNPQPGEFILDACAGFGGKTGHIAQNMQNKGTVMALDYQIDKLNQLKKQMELLGVSNVIIQHHDLTNPFILSKSQQVDRILLDAPCSGMGVLRRNPDTKWLVEPFQLSYYQQRQVLFLEQLAPVLKPGGILVYAVCSIEPEENEEVIYRFLSKNPEFTVIQNPH